MPRIASLWDRLGMTGRRLATGATHLAMHDPIQNLENSGMIARYAVQPVSDFTGILAAATSPFAAAFQGLTGAAGDLYALASGAPPLSVRGTPYTRPVSGPRVTHGIPVRSSSSNAIGSGVGLVPFRPQVRANIGSLPPRRTTVRSVRTSLPSRSVRLALPSGRRVGTRSIRRKQRFRRYGNWSKRRSRVYRSRKLNPLL